MYMWRKRRNGPNRKWTFIFISDANHQVHRLKIHRALFFFVPVGLGLIAAGIVIWLYSVRQEYVHSSDLLTSQMAAQQKLFEEESHTKDLSIEKMQTEIITLTEEAEKIRDKLEQIKLLENELRKLSEQVKTASAQPRKVQVGSSFGQGGESYPLDDDNIHVIAQQTIGDFVSLEEEMNELTDELKRVQEMIETKKSLERITPSIWPSSKRQITSGFGYRRDPFSGSPSFHGGIDISTNFNDPVYAAADGKVQSAEWSRQRGNYVAIQHGNGIATLYFHLNKILVQKGERVQKGQRIGLSGSSGRSTGTHLHYEVLLNGRQTNPMTYLKN